MNYHNLDESCVLNLSRRNKNGFPHDEFKKTIPLLYYILQMTCVVFFSLRTDTCLSSDSVAVS